MDMCNIVIGFSFAFVLFDFHQYSCFFVCIIAIIVIDACKLCNSLLLFSSSFLISKKIALL